MPPRVRLSIGGDWSHVFQQTGHPGHGEANVAVASRTFVAVLRRDWGLTLSDAEDVSQSKVDHPSVDARSVFPSGRHLLLQVVRPLESRVYKTAAEHGRVECRGSLSEAVDCLHQAINKKSSRKPVKGAPLRSAVTLLVDGVDAVHVALFAPSLFCELHGSWAADRGWESIWVVGPTSANRLDCTTGPVSLPSNWT